MQKDYRYKYSKNIWFKVAKMPGNNFGLIGKTRDDLEIAIIRNKFLLKYYNKVEHGHVVFRLPVMKLDRLIPQIKDLLYSFGCPVSHVDYSGPSYWKKDPITTPKSYKAPRYF